MNARAPCRRQRRKHGERHFPPCALAHGGGLPSLFANIVWVVAIGFWEALAYVVLGAIYCITIIGIPFGIQLFKMAKLSLLPFGATVE